MKLLAATFTLLPAVLAIARCRNGYPCPPPSSSGIECAGFLGLTCPAGYNCVDNPSDDCDPLDGGADCPGICQKDQNAEVIRCGGITGTPCPTGYSCIDDPSDSCDPENHGADCGGICQLDSGNMARSVTAYAPPPPPQPTGEICGGLSGIQCPVGQDCVDHPTPECPAGMAADCPGICQPKFCGGIANIQCPTGYDCIDNPNDGCDPTKNGTDCGGICQPTKVCGGFIGKPCADGYYCWDYQKGCNDCFGKCVVLGGSCGGKLGGKCPEPLVCVDKPDDGCDPQKGAKDCPMTCAVPN